MKAFNRAWTDGVIFLNRVSAIQLFDGKAMVEEEVHCERECEYSQDRIANRVDHLT